MSSPQMLAVIVGSNRGIGLQVIRLFHPVARYKQDGGSPHRRLSVSNTFGWHLECSRAIITHVAAAVMTSTVLQLTKALQSKGYDIIAACRKSSSDLSSIPSVQVVEGMHQNHTGDCIL